MAANMGLVIVAVGLELSSELVGVFLRFGAIWGRQPAFGIS